MNKTYRVVWNESTNTWVAVAEIATARGKSGKAKVVAASVAVVGALASPAHADLIWGSGSKAPGEGSMAMGINSDAKTRYTIAVGQDAVNKSNGDSAVLIGHDAQASSDANPNTGTNTMGQQVVIGESSRANSQSVAVGAQVYATGQASIAIGGDDLGNNDSKTSAGKYTGADEWRNYAGQPITVEGVSTKDASNPAIGFTSTTASGRGSIAIGHMSQSTGKASLAFGADSHAEADGAIAAGMASQAKGSAAVAIGVGAEAPEAHATAIGLKAKANGGNAFAAGSNAKADGENSIALGYGASTETNSATYPRIASQPDKTMNNIAIGKTARSGGLQTIAFGAESVASKSQSIAFGFDAQATGDQSVALGANTRSTGDSSVAIGGDDLDSVASTTLRVTSPSADNDAYNDTALAKQYRTLTGQNLVDFTPGNRYIGTTTGQAGVAVGVSAKAADLATAVGTKSHATGDYSAALGVGANATLANAVALGAGSTTKTNATDVPSATIGAITYGGGTSPFAGSGKVGAGDQVSVGAKDFERQIKHVAPGAITDTSTDAINGSQLFYVAKGLQDQISNNSATRSFGVNADNNSLKTHQLGKELAIVAGNTTEATSTSNLKTNVTQDAATGKTTVTVSMKDAPTFASVTTQDAAGNQTVTNAGGVTITPVSGNPVSLTKDGLNNGGNKITGVADGTIGAGSKEAVNGGQLHDLKENGFKIAADTGTTDTVKLTETVTYKGDNNIVTNVSDNQIGFKLANSITVGPATGGNPVKIDGNAGTVTGLTNKTWDPNNITSGRGATEDQLKAAVATTPLKVGDGNNGNPAGKVIAPIPADANKLATAGDIANAINNSGFQATAGGRLASGTTATATTVKPGQQVTFAAGNGLTVKQEVDGTNGNQTYTYALDAQTVVQNAQTPVVYTKADGTKVYKRPDGKFYDAPTGGNEVAAGDVIASMQNAAGNTTAPTTLANVKAGVKPTDAVNVSQLKGAADALGGGAGIADGSDPAVPAGTFIKPSYTITKTDGTTYAPVNNVGDALSNLNAEVIKPLTFAGDSGSNVQRKLGSTLNVKGGATGALTEGNIGVVADAVNNTLNIKLAQNIDLGTNGSVKTGATKMGNNGITIAAPTPTDPANKVSLTSGGLNNGGNKISNVADGTAPNDAVNLSQLQAMGKAAKTHYYSVNSSEQAAGSNYNNDGATGTDALAAGVKAQAAQRNSIAIGNEAKVENSPANPSSSSIAIGDKAKAQGDLALAIGPGATVSGENAAGGIAIGSAATSNNGGMAVGSGANAGNGTPMIPGLPVRLNNNVALGDSAKVKDDTNFRVALGSFSIAGESDLTAAPYKPTANANVAGVAGPGVELGEVSVGGDNTAGMGKTLYRRITNVAAGAADTDAVNVSQLKAATSKVTAGNGITVTPSVDNATGSTTYQVAADTTPLAVGDGTGGNPAGKVIAPAAGNANKLATAGDIANAINNSGFQATAGGNLASGTTATATTVKPGQQVTFAAGNGLTVKQDVDGTSGNQTYTYALDAQTVVQNAQTPVVYTDTNGNKVYKHADGNFYDKPEGQAGAQQVQASNVIASMQNAAGNTTAPTTLANVKGNLADTSNATGNPNGNDRATLATGNKGNNAATVNDVLNAGFTVQGNGADKDFVTHGDTINFVNGQGTVANVTSTNGVTEVKFDTPLSYADAAGNNSSTPSNSVKLVGSDPSKGVKLGNVAEGVNDTDAVNVAQLNAAKTKVQAADNSPVTVTGTGSSTDPYKVGVNTVTLAPATGTDAGKVAAPATGDAGKLVTAGDIANAINSSGFKATAGGNTTGAAPTEQLIKAGDTLTLKAGSGLTVEQTGSSFTYALNAQQVVQDAQTPVVYTKADGSKVYKHTDGNFYDQPNGAGTQVAAGDVIASMQGADGVTTATPATKDADGIMTMAGGTTLNNVASAGDITNPNNAYRAVNAGDLNNSVQKLVNNGFKIDADNGTVDTVKLGETVKYAGDGNIVTTVSNNQIGFKLANTVTIGSGTGSNPVKIDGTTGTVTGLTNKTWNPAAITSGRAATEDQLKAVADAANSAGAGFTIAGNSKAAGVTTADETIKAGETLSIKGTGTGAFTDYDSSNIQTQVGANGEVTVGLKKDLTVNSVTAGNTKVDNNGITINNPADPSKNVSLSGNGLNNGGNTITNVGDGVADTDAVNVRQLKAAQTNVNNLTNNVIGTDKPNITTYDVHGNVADNQNTVVEAINNMNTGGIKFFHVNDGTGSQNTAGTLSHPEDSSAKGNYGAAVGYQAKADGESSVAFGKGAQATGKNTIAIGTGNVVTGEGSGAIGDPTTITGRGTYSVGNNNGTISANEAGVFGNNNTLTGNSSRIIGNSSTVTTTDTFVMGNNSTSNVANSVVLGSNAAATSAATASSAGTTTYASSVINGTTYNYAGATPTGVVSVGNVGAERRVQNVAAGLISADSTDAINGSQLYATNSAINALQTGAAGIVQYSNGNAQPNGGTPTNHVTMVGADQNAPVTVHNVAAGVAPTDAVNVSQLQGVAGQIGKVADEADAGTAAAMAAAGLPQAYLPGKSMVAVSGSTYRGKQGYAVGFSAINDGGNWIVKGIATGNSKGKFGATIGAGYQW